MVNHQRVLILDGVAPECARLLEKEDIEAVEHKKLDTDELMRLISEFDAIAVRSATKVTRDVIATGANGRLRLIVRVGAGVNNIDVEEATRRSIVVENTPGTNARAVTELTIGALIVMARNIVHAHIDLKSGKKSEFRREEKLDIDVRENPWLFATKNTKFAFIDNSMIIEYGGEGMLYFKLDKNGIHELSKEEYLEETREQ